MSTPASTPSPLTIAFTFDRRSDWISRGLHPKECEEYQTDETIEQIAQALRLVGTVDMVGGVQDLAKRLVTGDYAHWDLVFNYCEGFQTQGREAQAPALLEAWGIPYTLSDAATLSLCIDKAKTKMVLEHYGIPTSPFACIPPRSAWPLDTTFSPLTYIYNSPHAKSLGAYPLFVKPTSASTSIGIHRENKAKDEDELLSVILRLSTEFPTQSLLVEQFLSGMEYTVGIMGTGINSTIIGINELIYLNDKPEFAIDPTLPYDTFDLKFMTWDVDDYTLKKHYAPNPQRRALDMDTNIAKQISQLCLKAWEVLGCRDCGRIDVRCDSEGRPNFLEVNPIPGLTPGWSDLVLLADLRGITYEKIIRGIVESALERIRAPTT